LSTVFLYTHFSGIRAFPNHVLLSYILGQLINIFGVFSNILVGESYSQARYTAFNLNPNTLAAGILFGVPMAIYLLNNHNPSKKYVYLGSRGIEYIYLILSPVAIIFSGSRQAIVGVTIVLSLYVLYKNKRNSRMYIMTIFSLILIATLSLAIGPTQAIINRILSIPIEFLSQSGSFGVRLNRWRAGIILFSENPILGTGIFGYNYAAEPILGYVGAPDNAYIRVLSELGIIGFSLFAFLIYCLINYSKKNFYMMLLLVPFVFLFLLNDLEYSIEFYLIGAIIFSNRENSHVEN